MATHQNDNDATELWLYFQNVINWIKTLFPIYRKEMKGIEWGEIYNSYHDTQNGLGKNRKDLNSKDLESKVSKLMADEDVTKKSGIYYYVFDGNEKHLSIRSFLDRDKRTVYEKQGGICPYCKNHFEFNEMQGDHIVPWSKGGKSVLENLQMLCTECNLKKGNN